MVTPNVAVTDSSILIKALDLCSTMEIFMPNRNNEMLNFDAFAYLKHRILADTSISR